MADTEEYFPRGGKKPIVQYFKQSSNFLGAPEKSEKKKKRPQKKSDDDDGYLSDDVSKALEESSKNCAIGLSYKTVKPGVLILGRVRQVHETKINIMLPCRMQGTVMACHISEPYNKLLEEYVNDQIDRVRELPSMFHPGQYVAVKVLEADGDRLMLSMMPQHVNAGKTAADLHGGCILQAAVSSVEDHGYVMDIGVPNTRAFLPKKNSNPEIELDTGMLTWVAVKSSDNSVVTLNSHLDSLQKAVLRKNPTAPLGPGTQVQFAVDTPLENGIEGHIFAETTSYVQRQHADTGKEKKPHLGQKVLARVLYVMPTRNTPFLTLKNIFETTFPNLEKELRYKEGDIVEDAQVLKLTGRSIYFKLGKRSVGSMSLKRIQVDEDLTDEEVVAKSYPLGSTHRVRILCYNLCDYLYSVTDQPSILNEKYFSLDQLTPGELVSGSVATVADNHVTVRVGRMTGYVPHAHMWDAGIFVDPKKATTSKLAKKKYKVGQPVKARVLSIDPGKEQLVLTLKPTMLAADLEVLSQYDQAQVGKAYKGVIRHIRPEYVLVCFFNNVAAFVPRKYVTKDLQVNLFEAFHLGQIVNCTILRVDVEGGKMSGSLTTEPFWPAKKREFTQKRKQSDDNEAIIPVKKQRTDSESSETGEKKKKHRVQKEEDVEQVDAESKKERKRKEKKMAVSESEEIVTESEDKNKLKKTKSKRLVEESLQAYEANEVEDKKEKKSKKEKKEQEDSLNTKVEKKKRKKAAESDLDSDNAESEDLISSKPNKKTKKKIKNEVNEDTESDSGEQRTKKSKKTKKLEVSEESDAIDTDIYDSDQVISPQDLALIDLSDCQTAKHYKRRVISLLKAINARTDRVDRINEKITELEQRGLDKNSKKLHNAMRTEKFLIEQRTHKLMEALNKAQNMYKEFNVQEDKTNYKKRERKELETEDKDEEHEEVKKDKKQKEKKGDENKSKKLKDIKVVDTLEPVLDVPSAKDFWSLNADNLTQNVQEEESSSSDDEQEEQPKKKRKKLTVAEKVAKVREEEERVREMERRAVESESQPRSSDQFERALLANPNSSQLWIAYMAFHLQATEIEKARAVGRRARAAISFREEAERLNVSLALLNCEHRFGTKETQQKALEEALQTNDTYKVHSKLLDILVDTGKHQELSSLVDLMMKKHKRDPQTYIACGGACFKLNLVDKARHVMQKAISVLEKKEHVNILVQFALMERDSGSTERAEALFEQILAVYPQRMDVCIVYVDMLMKSGDADRVRQVMERMTSQKLPARKMKILYKKWIEVEEKLGDREAVEKIREKAMEFIDKAKF